MQLLSATLRPHEGMGMFGRLLAGPDANLPELRPDIDSYRDLLRAEMDKLAALGKAMREEFRSLRDEMAAMRKPLSEPPPLCSATTWEGGPCLKPADRCVNMTLKEMTRCHEHAHLRLNYGQPGFFGEVKFWCEYNLAIEKEMRRYMQKDIEQAGDERPAEQFYRNTQHSDPRYIVGDSEGNKNVFESSRGVGTMKPGDHETFETGGDNDSSVPNSNDTFESDSNSDIMMSGGRTGNPAHDSQQGSSGSGGANGDKV